MKRMASLVFSLLMAVAMPLSAGLPTRNIPDDYKLDASKGRGVIVYSITENCPSTMTIKTRGVDNKYKLDLALDQGKKGKLDWKDPCGRLLILEYKKGIYEIYSYVAYEKPKKGKVSKPFPTPLSSEKGLTIKDKYKKWTGLVIPEQYFSKKFKIVPGKVTYGGSLHFRRDTEKKTTTVTSIDNKDRDLKLLFKKLPQIQPGDVVN